jgi:hypothetical protein
MPAEDRFVIRIEAYDKSRENPRIELPTCAGGMQSVAKHAL